MILSTKLNRHLHLNLFTIEQDFFYSPQNISTLNALLSTHKHLTYTKFISICNFVSEITL